MLKTCSNIEIPPNPSKKEAIIIFREIFFICIPEIIFIPFVISRKPVKMPCIKLVSIFNKLNIGERKRDTRLVMPLAFKIDIMLEKSNI